MKVTTRLCIADDGRIIPKTYPSTEKLFALPGAEVSEEIVREYGLEAYVDGAAILAPPQEIKGKGRK